MLFKKSNLSRTCLMINPSPSPSCCFSNETPIPRALGYKQGRSWFQGDSSWWEQSKCGNSSGWTEWKEAIKTIFEKRDFETRPETVSIIEEPLLPKGSISKRIPWEELLKESADQNLIRNYQQAEEYILEMRLNKTPIQEGKLFGPISISIKESSIRLSSSKIWIDFDSLTVMYISFLSLKFSSHEIEYLFNYLISNKSTYVERAVHEGVIHIRPADSGCIRALEFTGDGSVLLLLNKRQERDSLLGEGTFKKASLGLDLTSGKYVASLGFKSSPQPEDEGRSLEEDCSPEVEIRNLTLVKQHKGFPKLLYVATYPTKKNPFIKKTRITLEYYNRGNLHFQHQRLSIEQKKFVMHSLLETLVFLHANDHLHRDLKPSNIFLHKENKQLTKVIIGDLGSMCHIADETELKEHSTTHSFAPPEYLLALLKNTPLTLVTTKALDIWSLGVTLKTLFEIGPSWPMQYTELQMFGFIRRLDLKEPDAIGIEHLIWRMLQKNPDERISAEEALKVAEDLLKLPEAS